MSFGGIIHHFIIPKSSNNHRARAVHPSIIFIYIVFFVAVQSIFQTVHNLNPNILGYATDISVGDLVRFTNERRYEHGLSSLQLSETLSQAAKAKAIDMFNKDYWAHNSPDGVTPWKFILDSGYSYLVAGENLAKNFNDSRSVVDAWMASASHRDNILKNNYQEVGFAVVNGKLQGEETTLVVQMFGTPRGATLAQIPNKAENSQKIQPTIPPIKGTNIETIKTVKSELPSTFKIASIRNKPIFDIRLVKKELTMIILLFLASVFVIDGYFVYKHKVVRIAGRNWAHIIFLLTVLGIVFFAKAGAIL